MCSWLAVVTGAERLAVRRVVVGRVAGGRASAGRDDAVRLEDAVGADVRPVCKLLFEFAPRLSCADAGAWAIKHKMTAIAANTLFTIAAPS